MTVNGNIDANQALTIYLDSSIVHGNVVVNGGGDATMVDSIPGVTEDGLVLPIKDNVIDGNVHVQGWAGAWFGMTPEPRRRQRRSPPARLRRECRRVDPRNEFSGLPDSTEVVTNHIGGNLICHNNTPAAAIGDSIGGTANTVGGNKIGECAGL